MSPRRLLLAPVLSLLALACSHPGDATETPSVSGKADGIRANDRVERSVCQALGAASDCDPCEELDLYTDADCHRSPICHRTDPACIDCGRFVEIVEECRDNSGSMAGCFPFNRDPHNPNQYDEARACCDDIDGACRLTDDTVEVGAYLSWAPLPEGLAVEHPGAVGRLRVALLSGEDRYSQTALLKTLAVMRDSWLGHENDGVLRDGLDVTFEENASAPSFLTFLAEGTSGWSTRLSETALAELRGLMEREGMDNFRVFFARQDFDAFWGRGTTSYNLIYNTVTGSVIYLVLHPHYELGPRDDG